MFWVLLVVTIMGGTGVGGKNKHLGGSGSGTGECSGVASCQSCVNVQGLEICGPIKK